MHIPRQVPQSLSQYSRLRTSTELLLLSFLLVFLLRLATAEFHVDGQSMEPTLHNQEFIVVNKTAYLFQSPARGDIVVFRYPRDLDIDYIKRIIAIPGDIVSIIGHTVVVNGNILHEPYLNKSLGESPYPPMLKRIVAPNNYFVLGDNRDESSDSRYWGYLPREDIIGKALLIYWPLTTNNVGLLPNAQPIFSELHP
jgi:signal peptidase I